jgi:hypothetical protein
VRLCPSPRPCGVAFTIVSSPIIISYLQTGFAWLSKLSWFMLTRVKARASKRCATVIAKDDFYFTFHIIIYTESIDMGKDV